MMDRDRELHEMADEGRALMSDYIKREDAMELINKCVSHTSPKAIAMDFDFRHGEMNGLNWACDIIEAMPSEDVAPVRHGHWIYDCCDIVCSECGTRYDDELCYMLRGDCSYHEPRYCLWCGTRMDGGDE